jgi:hypothetical protein
MPPDPIANSWLRYSAHTFGDHILSWGGGGQEKWALWQFCPTTEESLKNALHILTYILGGHLAPLVSGSDWALTLPGLTKILLWGAHTGS